MADHHGAPDAQLVEGAREKFGLGGGGPYLQPRPGGVADAWPIEGDDAMAGGEAIGEAAEDIVFSRYPITDR